MGQKLFHVTSHWKKAQHINMDRDTNYLTGNIEGLLTFYREKSAIYDQWIPYF